MIHAVCNCRRCRARARRGMTLLEVMLAIALLMGAVMALSRIAFLARRHAIASEDRTAAQLICQNVMQEILAGIRPLQNVSPTPAEDNEQFEYAVDVRPLAGTPLLVVAVTVARLPSEDELAAQPAQPTQSLTTSDEPLRGYRLIRWIRSGGRGVAGDTLDTESDPLGNSPWSDESAPFGDSSEKGK